MRRVIELTHTHWVVLIAAIAFVGGGCGDSPSEPGDPGGQKPATSPVVGEFQSTGENVPRWIDSFCDVEIGDTREAAIVAMGEPTVEYDASESSFPQSAWEEGGASFTAFYDSAGEVEQLQATLDPDLEEQLDCEAKRR